MDSDWPALVEAIDAVLAAAKAHDVHTGIHMNSPQFAKRMLGKGFQLVTIASDSRLLAAAASRTVAEVRAAGQLTADCERVAARPRRLAEGEGARGADRPKIVRGLPVRPKAGHRRSKALEDGAASRPGGSKRGRYRGPLSGINANTKTIDFIRLDDDGTCAWRIPLHEVGGLRVAIATGRPRRRPKKKESFEGFRRGVQVRPSQRRSG